MMSYHISIKQIMIQIDHPLSFRDKIMEVKLL